MAYTLLDGTVAAIDFQVGAAAGTSIVSGTGTLSGGSSLACFANYVSVDIGREFTERTTFCSGGWRSRTPGLKQAVGRIEGFPSKGGVWSDPLAMFTSQLGYPFAFVIDTGCMLYGVLHEQRDHVGMRAAMQGERGIDFESTGSVSSLWVIT